MAHIAIDARKYFDFGIGSYIQNLVTALGELKSPHAFTLFFSPVDAAKVMLPEGWRARESRFKKYSVGEIALFGRVVRSARIELLHEPHYTLPMGLRGKSVVTVHDLIHLKMPEYFSMAQRTYAKLMLGYAVRNAGAVIAVSEKTKQDIVETFNVEQDRIHVVHHGIRSIYQKLDDRGAVEEFRRAFGISKPFVLYVGNVKPHKNIPTLLKAFAKLRTGFNDLELVFAGGSCLADRSLGEQARTLGIAGAIRDVNRLSERDLIRAYNAAEMVVLPSLYEGFGFPALEAMACGTPLIASNAGALAEVVGDAAMMFDPLSPAALTEAMKTVLSSSEQRAILVAKGKINARRFSWTTAAQRTLAIYERVLEQCRAR